MDKQMILKRLERLDPKNKRKALRILSKDMNHCNRKHDIALLIGGTGYPMLSGVTMVEIEQALKAGGQ